MLINIFFERELNPTSGRVTVRLLSLLVVVAGTLGVNSGANSAPINQLIRAPCRRPKSCYISTPRVRSRSNFEQGSAKYEKEKRYLQVRDSNIYSATQQAELRWRRASTTASRTLQITHSGEELGVVAHAGPRCQQIIPPQGDINIQSTDAMGQTSSDAQATITRISLATAAANTVLNMDIRTWTFTSL